MISCTARIFVYVKRRSSFWSLCWVFFSKVFTLPKTSHAVTIRSAHLRRVDHETSSRVSTLQTFSRSFVDVSRVMRFFRFICVRILVINTSFNNIVTYIRVRSERINPSWPPASLLSISSASWYWIGTLQKNGMKRTG